MRFAYLQRDRRPGERGVLVRAYYPHNACRRRLLQDRPKVALILFLRFR
jgi:hypothetical protein